MYETVGLMQPARNDLYEQLAAASADEAKPIAVALLETLDDPRFSFLRSQFIDDLHLIPGGVVLEVGCAVGLLLKMLHQRVTSSGNIHGLDLNPHFIKIAQRRAELLGITNTTFAVGDVHELPYREAMFDAVVSEKLLMHVAPLEGVLSEISRVLVPGGRAVFVDYDPHTIMVAGPDPQLTSRLMASAANLYASPLAARETARACSKAGLYVERVRGYLQVFEDPTLPTVEGMPDVWCDHAAAGRGVDQGTARRWLKRVRLAATEGKFMIAIPYFITVAIRAD